MPYRDVTFSAPISQFVGGLSEEQGKTNAILAKTYTENRTNYDKVNELAKNASVLGADAQYKTDAINSLKGDLDSISGNYEKATDIVYKAVNKYNSNAALMRAQQNFLAREKYKQGLQEKIGKGYDQSEIDGILREADRKYTGVKFDATTGMVSGTYEGYNPADYVDIGDLVMKSLPTIMEDSTTWSTEKQGTGADALFTVTNKGERHWVNKERVRNLLINHLNSNVKLQQYYDSKDVARRNNNVKDKTALDYFNELRTFYNYVNDADLKLRYGISEKDLMKTANTYVQRLDSYTKMLTEKMMREAGNPTDPKQQQEIRDAARREAIIQNDRSNDFDNAIEAGVLKHAYDRRSSERGLTKSPLYDLWKRGHGSDEPKDGEIIVGTQTPSVNFAPHVIDTNKLVKTFRSEASKSAGYGGGALWSQSSTATFGTLSNKEKEIVENIRKTYYPNIDAKDINKLYPLVKKFLDENTGAKAISPMVHSISANDSKSLTRTLFGTDDISDKGKIAPTGLAHNLKFISPDGEVVGFEKFQEEVLEKNKGAKLAINGRIDPKNPYPAMFDNANFARAYQIMDGEKQWIMAAPEFEGKYNANNELVDYTKSSKSVSKIYNSGLAQAGNPLPNGQDVTIYGYNGVKTPVNIKFVSDIDVNTGKAKINEYGNPIGTYSATVRFDKLGNFTVKSRTPEGLNDYVALVQEGAVYQSTINKLRKANEKDTKIAEYQQKVDIISALLKEYMKREGFTIE